MPYVALQTNASVDPASQTAFLTAASELVSERLGKPQSAFMGAVEAGLSMIHAASQDPAAMVDVSALGLTADQARELAELVTRLVEEHFGVSPERIYVKFQDVERSMWACNGTPFG